MVYDFISSAWPWIAMGLIAAIVLTSINNKKDDDEKVEQK